MRGGTGPPRRATDSPVSRERGFCPCCGYQALPPGTPGSYDVCPVCFWIDDLVAFHSPGTESDYNHVSLRAARENFDAHGACRPDLVDRTRASEEERDPNWPYG